MLTNSSGTASRKSAAVRVLVTISVFVGAVVVVFLLLFALAKFEIADSVVALVAVATSAGVAVQSLEVQRRLEREKQLGDRRAKLIESYRDVYESALQGVTPSEDVMRRFNVDLTFFGDEDAIKAWLGMRRAAASGDTRPAVILPAQMKLVRAMRQNLGHNDRSLSDADILGIILKNPDDLSLLQE